MSDRASTSGSAVPIIDIDESDTSSSNSNPWPYLAEYFKFKSQEGKSLKFVCQLCKPKTSEISAYASSPSNLRKHIKAKHESKLEDYTNLTSIAKKHKCAVILPPSPEEPKSKQSKLFLDALATKRVSQPQLDSLVLDLVIQVLLPFKFVELPAFKKLVTTLQPRLHVISRPTVKTRLKCRVTTIKKTLIEIFHKVDYVSTTTDCWSAHRKSFIGVTVHWIDSNFKRQLAALACRRLKGSHTFGLLAGAIDDIHSEYGIRDKVVKTITDNGSNFLKAFNIFGFHENEHEVSVCTNEIEATAFTGSSSSSEDDYQYSSVDEILSSSTSLQYKLPKHQPCSCHILNLIATKDLFKAELDSSFKTLHRVCFGKLYGLWNKTSRGNDTAERVMQCCGCQLIRPNQTRWNSTFLSVERVVRIYKEKGERCLKALFDEFSIKMLTVVELEFLQEYVATTKPFAQALDILQSELNCFMGFLLPTLYQLIHKLEKVQLGLKYCSSMAKALIDGIKKRFHSMLHDEELIGAAILLPQFKTDWTFDKAVIDKGVEYVKKKLECLGVEIENSTSSSTSEEDDESFFSSFSKRSSSKTSQEFEGYLNMKGRGLNILVAFPTLKKLSKMLNTPLPASAACERLFSCAGLIFTPKRANLLSENFEYQLLSKLNVSMFPSLK